LRVEKKGKKVLVLYSRYEMQIYCKVATKAHRRGKITNNNSGREIS
jgi:hypothetical protein